MRGRKQRCSLRIMPVISYVRMNVAAKQGGIQYLLVGGTRDMTIHSQATINGPSFCASYVVLAFEVRPDAS